MSRASRIEKISALILVLFIVIIRIYFYEVGPGNEYKKNFFLVNLTLFYPVVSLGCIFLSQPLSTLRWHRTGYKPTEKGVRLFGWFLLFLPIYIWLLQIYVKNYDL